MNHYLFEMEYTAAPSLGRFRQERYIVFTVDQNGAAIRPTIVAFFYRYRQALGGRTEQILASRFHGSLAPFG